MAFRFSAEIGDYGRITHEVYDGFESHAEAQARMAELEATIGLRESIIFSEIESYAQDSNIEIIR